jgi:hypothetical protein
VGDAIQAEFTPVAAAAFHRIALSELKLQEAPSLLHGRGLWSCFHEGRVRVAGQLREVAPDGDAACG